MRDLRKIRTKYEIRLDNRQIAFIAIGGLVVLLVIFALGVVVGKGLGRIEGMTEAKAPEPAAPSDLLTSLPSETKPPETNAAPTPIATPPGPATPYDTSSTSSYIPMDQNSSLPPPSNTPSSSTPSTPPMGSEPDIASEQPAAGGGIPSGAESIPVVQDNLTPGEGGFFTVQIAAYPTSFEAETMKNKLANKGLSPYIVKVEIPGKGTWFRVRVGKFSSKEGALSMAAAIKEKEGLSPFVAFVK